MIGMADGGRSERPKTVLADRGYKGAQIPGCRLLLAHTRKLPDKLKRLLKSETPSNRPSGT